MNIIIILTHYIGIYNIIFYHWSVPFETLQIIISASIIILFYKNVDALYILRSNIILINLIITYTAINII